MNQQAASQQINMTNMAAAAQRNAASTDESSMYNRGE